jgi:cell division protease FtsH
VAPRTRELVDAEVRRIVEECYADAIRLLRDNRDKLDSLAISLIQRETLDELDIYRIVGIERPVMASRERPPDFGAPGTV